jgi:hypothetical protein
LNAQQLATTVRQVLGYAALGLACVALLKFFGMNNLPIRGSAQSIAIIAAAIALASK